MSQPSELHELDRRERAAERPDAPPYYTFATLDEWEAYMDAHYPCLVDAVRKRMFELEQTRIAARIAALDGLGDCARYARMVLKALDASMALLDAEREAEGRA
jgi:hypothetical protein